MNQPLAVRVATEIYGRANTENVQEVLLTTPTPTARDLITAHISAELDSQLESRALGDSHSPHLLAVSGTRASVADTTAQTWSALIERRALLVVDGSAITDLNAPLQLSWRSQISLVRVLPLLIGG
ncbi:MAG TPA: hypothetical protein VFS21_31735 [Roseiflexaceae bacterium]|nr:hypothetical protein [Roseiflexaceae bacterium]